MMAARLTLVLVFLVPAFCAAQQAKSDNYTQALRRTLLLSNSPNVRLLPLGKSPLNRAIPALAIADFRSDPSGKLRVLVCAGQHGDEPNPVRAALDLGEKIAGRPDLLSKCIFIIAPIVNPDGLAAGRRTNARGADLNRDWIARTAVETQFVDGLVKSWKPQVLFDLHEWPDQPKGSANTIESAFCASGSGVSGTPRPLSSRNIDLGRLAAAACHASGLSLVSPAKNSNGSLFDRHYASSGYAAFMVETGPDVSPEAKTRAYQTAVLGMVGHVIASRVDMAALAPAARGFSPQLAATYFAPLAKPAPDANQPFKTACIIILAYCFALFAGKRFTLPERLGWSRKYTRCETPAGIPIDSLAGKRALVPLTTRSWVRQRLRSRYTGFPATLQQITPTRKPHQEQPRADVLPSRI